MTIELEQARSMEKKRVILIRSNLTDRDPWLAKEIDVLKGGDYEVILLGWDRYGQTAAPHPGGAEANYREMNLRLKAPWGIKILFFLPLWWCFVFIWLLKTKWDIAQAINFDSVMPAVLAARLKRKPIIYQIYDIYADTMALPLLLRKFFIKLEKTFMHLADAVILANEVQAKEVNGIPNSRAVTIYNPPPDFLKKSTPPANDKFTIFYAGVLYRVRQLNLDKVFQIIKDIDGVRLVIAGYGDMVEDIEQWVKQAGGKAEFLGKLSYTKVLERTVASDLLFALYSPSAPAVKHATCNKLLEAMMARKPIIVTGDTAMAYMVQQENCGIIVNPDNSDEIRQAIIKLKENPELCRRLGENGRRAYEQKYNMEIMAQSLLNLYETVGRAKK